MLLSIDTCGSSGSVALGRVDPVSGAVEILATAGLAGRTYSAKLVTKIGEILAARQAAIRDIEAIVVLNGPGSFTGIRVGLSTAKGLAQAAGIPLIALSRLELLARSSGLSHVLAVIDAGRGECYTGEFRDGRSLGELLLSVPEVMAVARRPGAGTVVCFAEDGPPDKVASTIDVLGQCGLVYVPPAGAAEALPFALERFQAGRFDDLETLDANYLRRSDAELFRATGRRSISQ